MAINDANLSKTQEAEARAAGTWPLELQHLTKYFCGQRYTDDLKNKFFHEHDVKNFDKLLAASLMQLSASGVPADEDLRGYAQIWLEGLVEKKNLGELVYVYRPAFDMFVRVAARHLQAAAEMNAFNLMFFTEFTVAAIDDVANDTILSMENQIEALTAENERLRESKTHHVESGHDKHMPQGGARMLSEERHERSEKERGGQGDHRRRESRQEHRGRHNNER